MSYHILHSSIDSTAWYNLNVEEDFVNKVIKTFLRGESELLIAGNEIAVGSKIRIYEKRKGEGIGAIIMDSITKLELVKSSDVPAYFERQFINTTDKFLYGRTWGDLKKDYFNVYINDDNQKPILIVLDAGEVLTLLEHWELGEAFWVDGRKVSLKNPKTIRIYDIDFQYLSKDPGNIKNVIRKWVGLVCRGKWSVAVLENFGKDVTSDWTIKPFRSLSKKSEEEMGTKFNWSTIHPEIVRVSKRRFVFPQYADAVEAAFKEINDLVKKEFLKLGNEELDGVKLMRTVFSPQNPKIKLTENISESEKNIQEGYMNIFAGAMMGIRNPKVHANVIINEKDAWEKIVLASHLMKIWDNRPK